MNDPNVFGYQPDGSRQQLTPGAQGQAPYKFSDDELRVLGQCNRESFYQRSLPIGTSLGVGTYIAIQKDHEIKKLKYIRVVSELIKCFPINITHGYLKPNPRFGAIPKLSFAVLVGYFVGKLSYQEACAEKLMALPGSYIGQLLREKRDGRAGGGTNMQSTPGMFGAGPNDIYSDAGPGSSLNLDTDRPVFSGDDSYRPDNEGGGFPSLDPERKQPALSYDDLRRRNRGQYTEARKDPYRLEPNAAPPISRGAPVVEAQPTPPNTNKYGDVMD